MIGSVLTPNCSSSNATTRNSGAWSLSQSAWSAATRPRRSQKAWLSESP